MDPFFVFSQAIGTNKKNAQVISLGLALFAAAAVVIGFQFDISSGIQTAGLILAAGFVILIIGSMHADRSFVFFCRFLLILLGVYLCALLVSVIVPGRTPVPPAYCLIKFYERCDTALDALAQQQYEPPQPVTPVPPPLELVTKSAYTVYLQFAGVVRRGDTTALTKRLAAEGWSVPAADRGGQRTEAAIGTNEVRYGRDEDKAAAELLAATVQNQNVTGATIRIVENPAVRQGTLEIWISRT